MTRASFCLEDERGEEEEKNVMPMSPAPVHVQEREETEGSTSMDDETWERVEDLENGRGILSWQQNQDVAADRKNGGGSETTRAQYEIHPRR